MNELLAVDKPVFWIIAGTSEARRLVEKLKVYDVLLYVSLATEYGRWFLQEEKNLRIMTQRLNQEEMISFIESRHLDCVIDATHPYAQEVTNNIAGACSNTGMNYIRLRRPSGNLAGLIYAENTSHAAEILKKLEGKIFSTCGSKELDAFLSVPAFAERMILRVLPVPEILQKCCDLGFRSPNIIAMQGPFSKELNIAMFKCSGAEILVTKDSGEPGGFREKIEAAAEIGMTVIVVGRPSAENGYTEEEVIQLVKKRYALRINNHIGKEE